jgi:hypothetical protein
MLHCVENRRMEFLRTTTNTIMWATDSLEYSLYFAGGTA